MAVPKYDDLFNPTIVALRTLGGSASISEIEDKVAELLRLSEAEISEIHSGNRTKLDYRLAWARNYLKRYGIIENSSRGVWSLTAKGNKVKTVNKEELKRVVGNHYKELDFLSDTHQAINLKTGNSINTPSWQEEVLNIIKALSPAEFERLCQRILRESGFIKVEVTGRSGDGGIDGRGILRVGPIIGFRVIFQCKRYKSTVSSQEMREFKGTMAGRADKGLFITTGIFTRDAKSEAIRDGAPPVDLIDGEQLVLIMKDLRLGVKIVLEEVIEVTPEWFKNF